MGLFKKKTVTKTYDKENKKPVIKASICNGEQVAGFKDIHTGNIEEVMLIKNHADLDAFKKMYGIDEHNLFYLTCMNVLKSCNLFAITDTCFDYRFLIVLIICLCNCLFLK